MHLLSLNDCDTKIGHLELVAVDGEDIPPYAILSHRWGRQEVLFADVEKGTCLSKEGFYKVVGAIDAELSEAINSMDKWYENAAICYVYLNDVLVHADAEGFYDQFASSAWFSRGWTLQELIAPHMLQFFSSTWHSLGDRVALGFTVSAVTRIPEAILDRSLPLLSTSIARRMSWAADRKTQRAEDVAYCLMGLFNINMPLLYGEGKRAFVRLQEEILKTTGDYSLFAWTCPEEPREQVSYHGLLADSPSAFKETANVSPYQAWREVQPFLMTNQGLSIQLNRSESMKHVILPCSPGEGIPGSVTLSVRDLDSEVRRSARTELSGIGVTANEGTPHPMIFPQLIPNTAWRQSRSHRLQFRMASPNHKEACYKPTALLRHLHPNAGPTPTPHELRKEQIPGEYLIPKFNPGPEVPILFERHYNGDVEQQSRFILLVGTRQEDELGFSIVQCKPQYARTPLLRLYKEVWDQSDQAYVAQPGVDKSHLLSFRDQSRRLGTKVTYTAAFSDLGCRKHRRLFAAHTISVRVHMVQSRCASASNSAVMVSDQKTLEIDVTVGPSDAPDVDIDGDTIRVWGKRSLKEYKGDAVVLD